MASTDDDPTTGWVLISILLADLTTRSRSPRQPFADLVQWLRSGDLPYTSDQLKGKIGQPEFWEGDVQAPLENNWARELPPRDKTVVHSPYLSRGGLAAQWENPSSPFAATSLGQWEEIPQEPVRSEPEQPLQVHTRIRVPWDRYIELRDKHVVVPASEILTSKVETFISAIAKFLSFPTQEKGDAEPSSSKVAQAKADIKIVYPQYPDPADIPDTISPGSVQRLIHGDSRTGKRWHDLTAIKRAMGRRKG